MSYCFSPTSTQKRKRNKIAVLGQAYIPPAQTKAKRSAHDEARSLPRAFHSWPGLPLTPPPLFLILTPP
jgi:hypothetical protein